MSRFSRVKRQLRGWRAYVEIDERWVMPVIAAVGGLFVSLSIGYAHALAITVAGWQLWTWLVTVIIVAGVLLMAAGYPPPISLPNWRILLVILLIAFLLRVIMLETIPGGLHVDEHGLADFTLRHVFVKAGETVNPFRSGPGSQPTLYNYLIRFSLAVGGLSITGLRLASAIAGTLAILATYFMVAIFDSRRVALISAIFMAGYHYHIHWSRLALNNIWDTLWVPATLALFAWGWKRNWYGGAILAGAAAGLSQYFYPGSRLGIFLLLFVIWRLWQAEHDTKRMAASIGLFAIVALTIASPLLLYALRDPTLFFDRARTVFGWKPELVELVTGTPPNYLAYAWHQLWRSSGAFTSVPEVTGFYDPKVPFLIGLSAPLFLAALIWSTYKRQLLPVLWILLAILFSGVLLSDSPGSSHYVVSIPAIVWLLAVPIDWLISRGNPRLAIMLATLIVLTDLVFYFAIYVPGEPRDLFLAFPPIPNL